MIRGIYCVAFGEPARRCALRMIRSAGKHVPEIPVVLCSDRALGPEDVLIRQPDRDSGGRRAKIGMYTLSPAEWDVVLYLDADTEIVGDIRVLFELVEDGWDLVICKAVVGELRHYPFVGPGQRKRTRAATGTLRVTQYSSGVMAFGRSERVARLFERWSKEWKPGERRDQAALMRALHREPLRVYSLGEEWNTVPRFARRRGIRTAGILHYPMRARRGRR
jgi:hypothetical protein